MHLKDWYAYFFRIGEPPQPSGNFSLVDCILAFSFGRNTWVDAEIASIMHRLEHHCGPEFRRHPARVFQYLRDEEGFDPGSVNCALAESCYQFSTLLQGTKGFHLIGQWEVMYALAQREPVWYQAHQHSISVVWPHRNGQYLNTEGFLQQAWYITGKRDLGYPVLVAHGEHLARCAVLARKYFGRQRLYIPNGKYYQSYPRGFDSNSRQPQTRDVRSWRFYERGSRILHALPHWLQATIRRRLDR